MRRETLKFLFDAREACQVLEQFLRGRSFEEYQSDILLRSAIERQLTIVGEALDQARKTDASLEQLITDLRGIIKFRHILVHGYSAIRNDTVWGILKSDLPTLLAELGSLLGGDANTA